MTVLRAILKSLLPYPLLPNTVAQRFILKQQLQDKILAGPFKGMHFSWAPWSDAFTVPLPKFLGTYEQELIPTIDIISNHQWAKIVDVGAADGYYAIGLALLVPGSTIIAFEELQEGRDRLNKLALLNKVSSQLDVRGRCEPSDLEECISGPGDVLIMMDVEGFEAILLDPCVSPSLLKAHILVEAHDCYVCGASDAIAERFKASHRITRIPWKGRRLSDLKVVSPFLKWYSPHSCIGMMNERLYATDWLWCTPFDSQIQLAL